MIIETISRHLIVYRSIMHLEQGNVIFIGDLVKAAMSDNFLDPPVYVGMFLSCVQHMILSNSY